MDFIFGVWALKRIAIAIAITAFLVAGWIALQVAMRALLSGVSAAVPESIAPALALVAYMLPPNFTVCVNALILAKVAKWLWERQREWAMALTRG